MQLEEYLKALDIALSIAYTRNRPAYLAKLKMHRESVERDGVPNELRIGCFNHPDLKLKVDDKGLFIFTNDVGDEKIKVMVNAVIKTAIEDKWEEAGFKVKGRGEENV